jgi:uncharacterized membrane protein
MKAKHQNYFNSLASLNMTQKWFRLCIITLLILAIYFRLGNIDQKFYTYDETYTSLRISGYTKPEVEREISGRVMSFEEYQKYQKPNLEKNVTDTVKGLALEESQLTPLYFIIAKFWADWVGSSVAAVRSLSAFISLLAFPCLFWLCRELFEKPITIWSAIILFAVSPVPIIYAQNARPYSLWIVSILLSSATLLRAMRVNNWRSWSFYAITVITGLYTHLYSVLVVIAQGCYVLAMEGFRFSKAFKAYMVAFVVGLVAFLPWLIILIIYPTPPLDWTQVKYTLPSVLGIWSGVISRTFLDLGFGRGSSLTAKFAVTPFILLILALVFYSIYFLCRKAPQRISFFILALILSISLPLFTADLILGKRLATSRHTIPSIVGIMLSVAYLVSTQIALTFNNKWQRKFWSSILATLLAMGILSCAVSAQSTTWWTRSPDSRECYPIEAQLVNQAYRPLIISDDRISIHLIVFGYLLDPKVRFRWSSQPEISGISKGFSDVFLFLPSDTLKKMAETKYDSKAELVCSSLWKMTKSKGVKGT